MSASPLGAEPGADGLQTCPACIPHRYTPCNANNSTLSSTTAAHALVRLLERQMHPAPISTPTAAASTARHDDWLLCKCKVWCRRPCAACASSMCACAMSRMPHFQAHSAILCPPCPHSVTPARLIIPQIECSAPTPRVGHTVAAVSLGAGPQRQLHLVVFGGRYNQ